MPLSAKNHSKLKKSKGAALGYSARRHFVVQTCVFLHDFCKIIQNGKIVKVLRLVIAGVGGTALPALGEPLGADY